MHTHTNTVCVCIRPAARKKGKKKGFVAVFITKCFYLCVCSCVQNKGLEGQQMREDYRNRADCYL